MKKKNICLLLLSAAISLNATAGMITNGDFQTCDLTGWQTDSFSVGSPGYDTDFVVANDAGDCSAQVSIDYFDTQEFFVNTLFTDLDLTASEGMGLQLSFDWSFLGEEQGWDPLGRDYWFAALGDGSGLYYGADGEFGQLLEGFDYDSQSFNVDLDSSFYNTAGWTLEFQLLAGFDVNFLGSTLQIDNVQLNSYKLPVEQVPEPSTIAIFILGSLGLLTRKTISKKM